MGSFLVAGNLLEFKGGVLKSRCTSQVDPSCLSWTSNEPQNITISAPSVVKSPVVVASIASKIGPCDDLIVDLTSSSGSGGRLWESVSFMVEGLSPNVSRVQDFFLYVSSNPSSARSLIVLPNGLLSPGFAYSLEMKLCNFLGGCGWKVKSFLVSSSTDIPVVILHSPDVISIFRNTSLLITGDAYTTVCGREEKRRADLFFNWSLYSDSNVLLSSSEMRSVSMNPREFKLPMYWLAVGSLYKLTLTVTHLQSTKSSSASVGISIKSGDLMCVLVGGDEVGLRVDGSVTLDLSRSYDSNVDNSVPPSLFFELRCIQISPSYRGSCPSLIFSSTLSFSTVNVTSNSSLLVVGDVFQIVITGKSSISGGDPRSCERVIRMPILAAQSPLVKLEVLSGSKMNPSSKLKILGRVDMGSSGEVRWSVDDDSIVLSSVSLSPLSRSLPSSPANSPHVLSFVIVGNSLPPQSSFKFTLSCSLVNGFSSSNSLTITTNSPPFGGTLEVLPVVGVMLETVFSILSFDWVDEDLPLSYEFGYLSSSSPSSSGAVMFRSKSQLSSASTFLPAGPQRSNLNRSVPNLTCVVMVFDQLHSSSHTVSHVLVEEMEISVDDLGLFLLNGVNSSRMNSDPGELKNALALATTMLNRVNCSGAPDCVSLNRMDCWSTEGTCGDCVPGYFGLMGSSNTPCLSSSLFSPSAPSLILVCDSDADCADGWFQECNLQLKICQSIQQTCSHSCSDHGQCMFASKYDLNETMDECGVLDGSCVPRCKCEEGFKGSSCSLTEEEFAKQVDLRHLMVETVRELMGRENVEASNVKSWMKTLRSVDSSDYVGLSVDSKILMSSLAMTLLRISVEVGLSIEELRESGMDEVVDMCVSGLSSSLATDEGKSDFQSLLMSLLRGYSDFMISDMSEDQYPVSSVNPFLRSSSFSLSSSFSFLTLSLPQSDLESLGTLTQHSISLPMSLTLPLQISISETLVQSTSSAASSSGYPTSRRLSSNVTESATQFSLPFFVSMVRPTFSSEDCMMKVILQHKPSLKSTPSFSSDVTDAPSASFEVDCVVGVTKEYEFVCPSASGGDMLAISCNGSVSG
jgi:hypothetical protein